MTDTTKSKKKKDLVFTRVFDAPVEQVWNVWVDYNGVTDGLNDRAEFSCTAA